MNISVLSRMTLIVGLALSGLATACASASPDNTNGTSAQTEEALGGTGTGTSCTSDADCVGVEVGPNTLACMVGHVHGAVCSTVTHQCAPGCVAGPPSCPDGEHACPMCGYHPPDGICHSVRCYPDGKRCPLIP